MKYNFYNNILIIKSIIYRLISMLIFSLIFGFKFAIFAGLLAFLIYLTYDYIFSKIFNIRAENKGAVLWFTGLPCSGKSTLADAVNEYLKKHGYKTERLDGDIVRNGRLSDDLGFSKEDRKKNINRINFVSKLLSRNKIITLCSFVSPYKTVRDEIRNNVTNFVEIFVHATPLTCANRDVKGMWKLAMEGKIKNFTGYDDPYELPKNPEIYINTEMENLEKSKEKVIQYLKKEKLI